MSNELMEAILNAERSLNNKMQEILDAQKRLLDIVERLSKRDDLKKAS